MSQLTSTLNNLTRKDVIWKWGKNKEHAFNQIKQHFLADIIIQYPNFKRKFFIYTNASTTHLGAELFQIDEEEQHQTLGFVSRTLSKAERNYSITELELLAILFACKKFRMYILGHESYILTDHKALTFLKIWHILNAKLLRWTLTLQEYNLNIIYITGKNNIAADTLTRYPQDDFTNPQKNIVINKLQLKTFSNQLYKNFQRITELQNTDNFVRNQVVPKENQHFIKYLGKWFTKRPPHRLVISENLVSQLIVEIHQHFVHVGSYKTLQTFYVYLISPSSFSCFLPLKIKK